MSKEKLSAEEQNQILQSLLSDLEGFEKMRFLSGDAKMGLGIAIEQVKRYMTRELTP